MQTKTIWRYYPGSKFRSIIIGVVEKERLIKNIVLSLFLHHKLSEENTMKYYLLFWYQKI